jgi:hypothetical protein
MRALALSLIIVPLVVMSASRVDAAEALKSKALPVTVTFEDAAKAELATTVLAAAERAWTRLVVDLGYVAPWTGGGASPIERGIQLRIGSTGLGAGSAIARWGSNVADTPVCDCSASIIVEATTPPNDDTIAEAVFHELVHATQYASDCTEAPSAYEGFAVAAQAKEFPSSRMVPGVVAQFQKFPEYPLDYWTMHMPCDAKEPCFPYQLGAALFPLYLVERFEGGDARALGVLFSTFGQAGTTTVGPPHPTCRGAEGPSWLDGVRRFVEAHGATFDDAFDEFTRWRAVTGQHDDGRHFAAGASLPEPAVAATRALDTAFAGELDVREYGSRYIALGGVGALEARTWRFRVSGDPAARWRASVVVGRAGNEVAHTPLAFTGSDGETVVIFPAEATWAVLVVAQLDDGAHAADAMDYDSSRRFRYEAEAAATSTPGADAAPVAPIDRESGCALARRGDPGALVPLAIATALAGARSLRRRRHPRA